MHDAILRSMRIKGFFVAETEDCVAHDSVVDELDCKRRFPETAADIRKNSRSDGRVDGWLYGVGEVQRSMMRSIPSEWEGSGTNSRGYHTDARRDGVGGGEKIVALLALVGMRGCAM